MEDSFIPLSSLSAISSSPDAYTASYFQCTLEYPVNEDARANLCLWRLYHSGVESLSLKGQSTFRINALHFFLSDFPKLHATRLCR